MEYIQKRRNEAQERAVTGQKGMTLSNFRKESDINKGYTYGRD
jgi:hypothetical protein